MESKNNKKTCPECKTPFQPKRSDQKFCDTSCRWNAWRKREELRKGSKQKHELAGTNITEQKQESEQKDLFTSLRGVAEIKQTQINQEKPKTEFVPIKISEVQEVKQNIPTETTEYKEAITEKQRVDAFGKRVIEDLEDCTSEIAELNHTIEKFSNSIKSKSKTRIRNCVDTQDLFGDEILNREMDHAIQIQTLRQELNECLNRKTELNKELDQANREMNSVMNKLKTIPQFEKPKPEEKKINFVDIFRGLESKKITEKKQEIKPVEKIITEPIEINLNTPVVVNALEEENAFVEELNTNNPKILSSRQIRGMDFKSFPLTGKWKEFLGEPQYSFHLGIHGKPGWGKSTFCVQFADYLAKTFGKVIYISGEEGLSKTVQDKLVNNCIDNPYLFFADIRSFDEIKNEIPNEYHFIFIDSLDTLKIDAPKLRELKELYPQTSFITISQSTKDGKMRGSQQIMHDNDITVAVIRPGIAVTEKNRFGKTGLEFKIFDSMVENKKKTERKPTISKPNDDSGKII